VYVYRASLVKIVDADTLDLRVDLGFRVAFGDRFQLAGINAPEHNTVAGKAAIQFVTEWFKTPNVFFEVRTYKDEREKWLATVVDGPRVLNNDLVTAGHAVPYSGGKR
jgi:micrococcal nuclease